MEDKIYQGIKDVLSGFKEVALGYLFGSYLRGDFRDIDVAVLFSKPLEPYESMKLAMRIAGELEREFGHRYQFDVKVLNSSPLYFQHEVIKTGRPVYSRDEKVRTAYEIGVLTEYLDYRDTLMWFDREYLARA